MIERQPNRRVRRSEDVQEALSLQLAASAERAHCSAMVLADELGTVIASTGDQKVGEEIAAVSPILASGIEVWRGKIPSNRGYLELSIAPIELDNSRLFISASEGRESAVAEELFLSGLGISRILA